MTDLRSYQPSFTAGELAPSLHGRNDLAKWASGLRTAKNVFVHASGGVSNRAGLEFCGEVKNSTALARLIPFQFNTAQAYQLEFGDETVRVFRDGGVVLSATTKTITAATKANPCVVTAAAHGYSDGDEISIAGVVGMTELNADNFIVRNPATNTVELETLDGDAVDSSAWGTYTSGGSINEVFEFVSPYADTDLAQLVFIQEADVMYITHTSFAPRKVSRTADDNWTLATPTFAPGIAAPASPSASAQTGSGATTYTYKVSAVADESGEESLPSAEADCTNDLDTATYKNRVTWTAVTGAKRYIVYKEDNGIFGYIGGTEATQFDDENITADVSDTPQEARNPFNATDDYPRCCTFVDQRLAFASTNNNPQAVWTSQSANYENFGVASPAKASDAITFRIRAREVNEIRAMLPMRGLMVFTSGAEWNVQGSETTYLTQTVNTKNEGYRGSSLVQPIVVGNAILFAQARGGVIRDFGYQFTDDGFVGRDLTIMARHLFKGRSIKSWAFAQAPESVVWVVLDNGDLVSMTYMREHDVWGWTRHETDGTFEDVSVIAEGDEDVPYFIVKRTINSVDRRFVERLHTREFDTVEDAFFVDSGLSHDGSAIDTIRLAHLPVTDVVALVDGNVVRGLTTDADGWVTLPYSGSVIHAGLPYTATIETLDLDLGQVKGIGSSQGRQKSIGEVSLKVERTRGIFLGPYDGERTSDMLIEYKQREGEAWNEAIGALTGNIEITPMWDWNDHGRMVIKQFDPLPMTILSIAPDVSLGG